MTRRQVKKRASQRKKMQMRTRARRGMEMIEAGRGMRMMPTRITTQRMTARKGTKWTNMKCQPVQLPLRHM